MKLNRVLAATVIAALLGGPVFAHGFKVGSIEVEHPWSRSTVASASTAVVYMVVHNRAHVASARRRVIVVI